MTFPSGVASSRQVTQTTLGIVAMVYVGFHIANLFISFGPIGAKIIHVCLGMVVLALDLARYPGRRTMMLGIAICLTALPAGAYFLSDQIGVLTRYGFGSATDIAAGAVIVLWMFVLTVMYFGPAFGIVGLVFFVYAYLGSYMPAPFTAPAVDYVRVTSKLTVGSMGDIVELSVTVIFVVLLFGSLLQASGAGEFIWRIAGRVARRIGGGTGAIAVSASGLVASFTGVGAATTAITAPIAIPIMKRDGYSAEQAAAIEAIASTGGQITPPILGLAAFLMADFLGIPYNTILVAAILPAFLFYLGLLAYVTLEYRRRSARSTVAGDFSEHAGVHLHFVRGGISFLVPMTILVMLITRGVSIQTAVLAAIASVGVLALLLKIERNRSVWLQALVSTAVTGASIGMAAGILDVLMSSLDITQLGMLMGFVVGELAGDSRLGTLLILIVAAYVMGMGMPGIAIYTVLAITLVPAMTNIGVAPMVAHFLIMYMIIMSNFTPPVAPTLVITAKIADAKYMLAGLEAMKAGAGAMFLPFLIFLFPDLLVQGASVWGIGEALGVCLLLIFLLTVSLTGWFGRDLSIFERLLLAAGPIAVWGARYEGAQVLYWSLLAGNLTALIWLLWLGRLNGRHQLRVAARD